MTIEPILLIDDDPDPEVAVAVDEDPGVVVLT
jgi:hypothetical protein